MTQGAPLFPCSVDGGELFDRIVDDNYNLTELDTILFIRQICEGVRHMHQMYILHLDLKVGCVLHHLKCKPFPNPPLSEWTWIRGPCWVLYTSLGD